jgi:uncharacterized protein (TIGR03083 family)
MAASSPWDLIHAERAALADDLDGISDSDWRAASLCDGWTVHDVLGHILVTAKMTPSRFLARFAGSGFRFDAMSAKAVESETAAGPAATLAELRAHVDDTTSPPGPVDSWLGETIVHSTDIRWPLALSHEVPVGAVVRIADFYKGSNLLIGAKKRVLGLGLRASDVDWAHGDGPEVNGPILPLVMAMTGRSAALEHLSGAGVPILAERC